MNIYTKKQSFLWRKILIGVIALFIFIGLLNIFNHQIKNTFYFITSPFLKVLWRMGDSNYNFFAPFLQVQALKKENDNLKQENQKLLSQIFSLQETVKQNQAINEAIQNTRTDKYKLILAETIGLDSTGDFILLNKGLDDGIFENMPVISSQKVLYGKTFKVYKNFSQVMLISNKNSVVDAKIQDTDTAKTPIYGAIKGNGNLSVYLDLVPLDAQIKEGDTLITSGLEGVFPKDLLVGKITYSDKNDLKPFQTAQIQSFFSIKNIDNLFIITDYKQTK